MITTLVVDDEPLARKAIVKLLQNREGFEVIAQASHGKEALEKILEQQPQLVFLDIRMPTKTGLELLHDLDNHVIKNPPRFIFTTAFDQYALEAFDHNAIDYLLKPYSNVRFSLACDRAEAVLLKPTMSQTDQEKGLPKPLLVKTDEAWELLDIGDLMWAESCDHFVALHFKQQELVTRLALGDLEKRCPHLIQVHRCYLVNRDWVKRIHTSPPSLQLKDGKTIPIATRRLAHVKQALGREPHEE